MTHLLGGGKGWGEGGGAGERGGGGRGRGRKGKESRKEVIWSDLCTMQCAGVADKQEHIVVAALTTVNSDSNV